MSIWLYSGTPGSGKSYHAACDVIRRLRAGGGVIANFPINESVVKKCKAHCEYWDNSEFSAKRLIEYALKHHVRGKEGQTLVVIDEAQLVFNCRDFGRKDRNDWVAFFSQHRHLGFNIILIAQSDKMLDKQIRVLIESEVKHRKMGNYGIAGWLLSLLAGGTLFYTIEYWYGGNKLIIGKEFLKFHKKKQDVYDSYRMFSDIGGELAPAAGPGGTACGGAPENAAGAESQETEEHLDGCKKTLVMVQKIRSYILQDWAKTDKLGIMKIVAAFAMFVNVLLLAG